MAKTIITCHQWLLTGQICRYRGRQYGGIMWYRTHRGYFRTPHKCCLRDWITTHEAVLYLLLSKVLVICNVFSHGPRLCSALDRKQAREPVLLRNIHEQISINWKRFLKHGFWLVCCQPVRNHIWVFLHWHWQTWGEVWPDGLTAFLSAKTPFSYKQSWWCEADHFIYILLKKMFFAQRIIEMTTHASVGDNTRIR